MRSDLSGAFIVLLATTALAFTGWSASSIIKLKVTVSALERSQEHILRDIENLSSYHFPE